jgi:hypothetical protein
MGFRLQCDGSSHFTAFMGGSAFWKLEVRRSRQRNWSDAAYIGKRRCLIVFCNSMQHRVRDGAGGARLTTRPRPATGRSAEAGGPL